MYFGNTQTMTIRRSLFFSFLDRYSGLLINIVSSMVLARLLTPADIGVFSITMVLLTFASTVRDMGAGSYMVQEKELTIDRIRAVWALQLGIGTVLAVVVAIASYPVALFYGEPKMRSIMYVVALNYVIGPFGSLTHAWLMREMQFHRSVLIRFSGNMCGTAVAIGMAWHDFGPISLAFGSLTTTVVGAFISVYFRPKFFPWLPGISEIKRVLAFGSRLTGSTIVGAFANSAPELFLGKLQGVAATGLFSRANGLVQMFQRLFVDAVGAVCMPWFSKISREGGGLGDPFLKATAYVTACAWSFCLAIICLAQPAIRLLYGKQWDLSVDPARILAVAALFAVPAALCPVVLLATGAVSTLLRLTAINAVQSITLVALGATYGLLGLSTALMISAAITSVLWLRAALKHTRLKTIQLAWTMGNSLLVAATSALGPFIVLCFFGPYSEQIAVPIILGGLSATLGFGFGVWIFKHPLRDEFSMIRSRVDGYFR